ncbi:hypothetical protein K9L27_04325 [Candidatus Gracilibacteria bacterium]|nr:hypothetical protein [Candidatus Gracilibacteria bacterium]
MEINKVPSAATDIGTKKVNQYILEKINKALEEGTSSEMSEYMEAIPGKNVEMYKIALEELLKNKEDCLSFHEYIDNSQE